MDYTERKGTSVRLKDTSALDFSSERSIPERYKKNIHLKSKVQICHSTPNGLIVAGIRMV
jgi:hypothetical protein